MRRSFRTDESHDSDFRGFTPGWYARPRWGKNAMPQRSARIPAQGNALGSMPPPSPRSDGTPHTLGRPTNARSPSMRRSFRTDESHVSHSRGFTPGWYARPRWGKNAMPQRGFRIPAQGNALGSMPSPFTRSDGTPHTLGRPTNARSPSMRRSFRTDESHDSDFRGFTPGWYARPRWGKNVVPQRGFRIPAPLGHQPS